MGLYVYTKLWSCRAGGNGFRAGGIVSCQLSIKPARRATANIPPQ